MADAFAQGLGTAKGFVIPVQRLNAAAGGGWLSEVWQFRRGHLFLIPGDSPIGYRLPLDSRSPISPRRSIPTPSRPIRWSRARRCRSGRGGADLPARPRHRRHSRRRAGTADRGGLHPPLAGPRPTYVRTALAVEPRDGRLCIFMPPVETLEAYLDIVYAVEAVAAELKMPVHLEAIRRPSIRASMSSASLPIPACWR